MHCDTLGAILYTSRHNEKRYEKNERLVCRVPRPRRRVGRENVFPLFDVDSIFSRWKSLLCRYLTSVGLLQSYNFRRTTSIASRLSPSQHNIIILIHYYSRARGNSCFLALYFSDTYNIIFKTRNHPCFMRLLILFLLFFSIVHGTWTVIPSSLVRAHNQYIYI